MQICGVEGSVVTNGKRPRRLINSLRLKSWSWLKSCPCLKDRPRLKKCTRRAVALLVSRLIGIAAAGAISVAAANFRPVELGANLSGHWRFVAEEPRCVLELDVPDFGIARFVGTRGQPLRFEVLGHRRLFTEGAVDVFRVAPFWHASHPSRARLGAVEQVSAGKVQAAEGVATEMLMSLYGGYQAELAREGWFAADRRVGVTLTNLDLRSHYGEFVDCYRGPPLPDFAEVERTRVNYPSGVWRLEQEHEQRLGELAEYLREDPSVKTVYIDGHTDDIGSTEDNLTLARQRAETVADFLAGQGVPSSRLTVRYHGDRYPVAGNGDEHNRARNRRTTVRLERGDGQDLVTR